MDQPDILQQARLGSDEAWSALVQENGEIIFRLVYLRLGNAEEAKDVTQEAFIKAWKGFRRFDPQRPFRPWIIKIALNLAKNRLRFNSRRQKYMQAASSQSPPASQIEDHYIEVNQSERLWQAVRTLKSNHQEVIYLRYFLELPIKECAQVMRVEDGTVKSRANRALARLKKTIQVDFPDLEVHHGQ